MRQQNYNWEAFVMRWKSIVFGFLIVGLLSSTSCMSKTDSESKVSSDTCSLPEYKEVFARDVEEILATEYNNLDVSDCSFRFSDCGESIAVLLITEPEHALSDSFSIDTYKQQVESQLKLFFPDTTIRSDALYCNAVTQDEYYPLVSDYYEQLKDGSLEYTWFMYETESEYAWMSKSDCILPYRMSKGTARTLSGSDSQLASWLPGDSCELVQNYQIEEITPELSYHLINGDVTVADAIAYVENDYLKSIGCVTDFGIDIAEVDVLQVTPEIYGYNLLGRKTFDNIPFDTVKDMTGSSSSSDGREYARQTCEIFMIESNDVDTFLDIGVHKPYEIVEEFSEIITLKKAVQIASETLTSNIVFDVRSAELLYTTCYDEGSNYTTVTATPEWAVEAYNPNDGYRYMVYVNAKNGAVHYQRFTS